MAAAASPPKPGEPDTRDAAGLVATGDIRLHPQEAARYIAEFTLELSSLAKRSRLDLLGYLLDMAHVEASRSAAEGPR